MEDSELQQQLQDGGGLPRPVRRKGWIRCWEGLPCFSAQKGGKRIVPAARVPEGNATENPQNRQGDTLTNYSNARATSFSVPPPSPASFSSSAIPSTAPSPSIHLSLSANSPGGPSNAIFATGPYAHETQLVSPPVFSAYTTEPSTAPFTPPPELAHLTVPSSPEVPYAQFMSSMDHKVMEKNGHCASNDPFSSYSLQPGSRASSNISSISWTSGDCFSSSFPDREFSHRWDPSISPGYGMDSRVGSGRLNSGNVSTRDSNFFCPATFAQFYLDQTQVSYPPFPLSGGRLSLSRESDAYVEENELQNRHIGNCKQDKEEIEAYRASFGFSADEMVTTRKYAEISVVRDVAYSMEPLTFNHRRMEDEMESALMQRPQSSTTPVNLPNATFVEAELDHAVADDGALHEAESAAKSHQGSHESSLMNGRSDLDASHKPIEVQHAFSTMDAPRHNRRNQQDSLSDTEIDYSFR